MDYLTNYQNDEQSTTAMGCQEVIVILIEFIDTKHEKSIEGK